MLSFCINSRNEKSLKLNEGTFNEAERIKAILKVSRNSYINKAVDLYNRYQKRLMLKTRLRKESELVRQDSLLILEEFERLEE